jgi:DNA-binding CsgD family transcriptional regulator
VLIQPVICPVLVGRAGELESLRAARRALAQSRGAVILVAGEAGIGKSRLLEKFVGETRRSARDRNVAAADCLEFAEQPFGPFRALFSELGIVFPGSDDPRIDKREIFVQAAESIRAQAESRATILSIEDLHWADRSTLELLTFIAPRLRGTRALLIATYRAEEVAVKAPLAAALGRLRREATVAYLELGPLDRPSTHQLIEHIIDEGRSCPPDVREAVAERCEGNPFFAEELLKDALEGKADARSSVPFSIRASIVERVQLLDATARRTLGYAAVLGYRFDAELLALTLNEPVEAALSTLRQACALNLLAADGSSADRFRFRHALTRDAVYSEIMGVDAKRTHARILTMLEGLGEAERNIDALAYHAWAAEDAEKTVTYNRRAGRSALRLRALPEARTFAERVVERSAADTLDEAEAIWELAEIEELIGDIRAADRNFELAADRFCSLGAYDRGADAMRCYVVTRNNLADPRSVTIGRNFLETYGDRVTTGPRDQLVVALARISSILYDNDLIRHFLEAVEDPAGLPARPRANFNIANMALCWSAGDAAGWLAFVAPQLRLLEEMPPYNMLTVLYSLAFFGISLGSRAVVEDAFERASRIERRWGFGAITTYGAALRASHATKLGRLKDARSEFIRAYRAPEVMVAVGLLAEIAPTLAAAFDEPNLLGADLQRYAAGLRSEPTRNDDGPVLANWAAWNAEHGRLTDARADLRIALTCFDRPSPNSGETLVFAAMYLSGGDPALERLRALIAGPFAPSDRTARIAATLADAILERRFGSIERGVRGAKNAAIGFRNLGWQLWETIALREAGEVEQANAIARRMGIAFAESETEFPKETGGLSSREHAVALEIARSATNAEIAERLSISSRTVEKHIASIFKKLGVRKRSYVAAMFARRTR